MLPERMQEFIIMLLIENRCLNNESGSDYLSHLYENYNIADFNNRYTELLDEFMNQYALTNAEKSD